MDVYTIDDTKQNVVCAIMGINCFFTDVVSSDQGVQEAFDFVPKG